MKSTIFWDITPCSPFSVNRRFRGTYRLHLQGLKNKMSKKPAWKQVTSKKQFSRRLLADLNFSTMKMEAICYSETSVQRTTRRYIPEDDTLRSCLDLQTEYRRSLQRFDIGHDTVSKLSWNTVCWGTLYWYHSVPALALFIFYVTRLSVCEGIKHQIVGRLDKWLIENCLEGIGRGLIWGKPEIARGRSDRNKEEAARKIAKNMENIPFKIFILSVGAPKKQHQPLNINTRAISFRLRHETPLRRHRSNLFIYDRCNYGICISSNYPTWN
jgi:hypothetical protein